MELLNSPIFWMFAATVTIGLALYASNKDGTPAIAMAVCVIASVADICYALHLLIFAV